MRTKGSKPNRTVNHTCKRCRAVFQGPNCYTKFCKSCRPVQYKENEIAYHKTHRAEAIERVRKHRLDPEYRKKVVIWNNNWGNRNPEKRREIKRLAQNNRNKRLFGYLSPKEWEDIKEKYGNQCIACFRREPEIRLSIDHVIPISKGGKNIVDNIQPLCRSCNAKKQATFIDYRLLYGGSSG